MCPKPNDTGSALSKKSHVEDYTDFIPGLFHALTAEPDKDLRWTTFTFPIDIDISQYSPKPEKEIKYYLRKLAIVLDGFYFNIMIYYREY